MCCMRWRSVVTHDAVEKWVDDLPMGAAKHIGFTVLLASLAADPRDGDDQGEGSGGSSAS